MEDAQLKAIKYVIANASKFVQHISQQKEWQPDFSESSLKGVNEEIELFADHYAHMTDEGVKDLVNVEVASYVTEIARKKYDGTLYWHSTLNQPVFLTGLPDYEIHFLPFKKIKELLENPIDTENIILFWERYVDTVNNSKKGDTIYIQ